ncbi:MAG: hypothetical protein WA614_08080, partial [Acidimicrobiales bacterium]
TAPGSYWTFTKDEIQGSATLATNVDNVRKASTVPPWVTDMRIIDIVVWMRDTHPCRKMT